MSLESLKELRASELVGTHKSIGELADVIQSEVDEKYMLLPVDKEGVPIHFGDIIDNEFEEGEHIFGEVIEMRFDEGLWQLSIRVGDDAVSVGLPCEFTHRKQSELRMRDES